MPNTQMHKVLLSVLQYVRQVRTGETGEDRNTNQAVLLPGFRESGSELLSGDEDLHFLEARMVPKFGLERQLVLWYCFT